MKVGLAVHRVYETADITLKGMIALVCEAFERGAELVLFSEAAPTGLANTGDPAHDLPLGEPVPGGDCTGLLALVAEEYELWVGMGVLEREKDRLYDTAVLIDPRGRIALKYRRIQPQWHGKNADPLVYCEGTELVAADTSFGRVLFLICGDLFDDAVVSRARALEPRFVLFPFARCFSDASWDQDRWDLEELPTYAARVRSLGVTTLMVNYLADRAVEGNGCFGGAMALGPDGAILKRFPLGREGVLMIEV